MNGIILPIMYILSGFFMKLSDDYYDDKHKKLISSILGIVCGIATAVACSLNFDAACIFIAILLGNIIAFKVDGIHHIVTMLTFLIIFLIFGLVTLFANFSIITIFVLVICMLGAFLDELGNDNEKIYSLGKFFELFFDYRCSMKIVILILALFGLLNIWSFVFFIFFELSYEFARILFEKYIL